MCLVTQSCPTPCDTTDCSLPGSSVRGISQARILTMAYCALLQGIFPTQAFNPGLPHFRWIHYHLSHPGKPKNSGWVAYPFYRGSSGPRN